MAYARESLHQPSRYRSKEIPGMASASDFALQPQETEFACAMAQRRRWDRTCRKSQQQRMRRGPHHRRGAIPARIRRRQRHSTAQPRRYFHLDSPSEARNWLGARKCDFGISRGTHPSEEVPRIHTDFVAISIARTASSGQSRKTRCMGEPARRVRTSGMRLNRRRSTSFRTPGPARNISKNWESHSTPAVINRTERQRGRIIRHKHHTHSTSPPSASAVAATVVAVVDLVP